MHQETTPTVTSGRTVRTARAGRILVQQQQTARAVRSQRMCPSECGSLCRLSQQLVHLRIRCELHCCLAILPLQLRIGIGILLAMGVSAGNASRHVCMQAGNIGLNLRKSSALMGKKSRRWTAAFKQPRHMPGSWSYCGFLDSPVQYSGESTVFTCDCT